MCKCTHNLVWNTVVMVCHKEPMFGHTWVDTKRPPPGPQKDNWVGGGGVTTSWVPCPHVRVFSWVMLNLHETFGYISPNWPLQLEPAAETDTVAGQQEGQLVRVHRRREVVPPQVEGSGQSMLKYCKTVEVKNGQPSDGFKVSTRSLHCTVDISYCTAPSGGSNISFLTLHSEPWQIILKHS
jgi:hypothetical protein